VRSVVMYMIRQLEILMAASLREDLLKRYPIPGFALSAELVRINS